MADFGKFRADVTSVTDNRPIEGARVSISYGGQPQNIIEEIMTDSSGQTPVIELEAPPVEYSLAPSATQPYSEYTVTVEAPGYEECVIAGSEVLGNVTSIQNVTMLPKAQGRGAESFVIGPHTLFGDYPPKIAEPEIKDIYETGEIVLSRVVIPEYVVVHDGPPTDSSAQNYYVRYRDYIKNVASSEIYATWPQAAILANVLAIMSFTLNRVYTEWYRNKGYDFTITSSTAFDHKWIPERNIFDEISSVVDTVFNNFLSRPGVRQPILTQYCDGRRVTCPDWMSQWGSKSLATDGYSAIEILRYYYGDNMYINSTEEISGVPLSWPGYDLTIGASGPKILQMQEQLNVISDSYPLIPKIAEDGIYGNATADAVRTFQKIFDLPQSGVTDFKTWYKISAIYVGVSRIAELV